MTRPNDQSWGRYPKAAQSLLSVFDRNAPLPPFEGFALPRGNGRSYGDSCLNPNGTLLLSNSLDRFVAFNPATGVIRCEAGVTLASIIELTLPQGWFLPVTPGTRHVTLGGAVANDVHGKNHHVAGSFGNHILKLELLRSDGDRLLLDQDDGSGMFAATIGGLGLTGFITWVELQLRRVPGPWIETETIRFNALDEFFSLSSESAADFEYTVAWIDCLASGSQLGRGHFLRGNHARCIPGAATPSSRPQRGIPLTPPMSLVNHLTLRPFNTLYYWRQLADRQRAVAHYQSYFYPLDGISHWNRMYGPSGFLQHQCALPREHARDAVAELLSVISRNKTGSFLAVLKEFGDIPAKGILSFPRPGTTLALDFPNTGSDIFKMLERLDRIVEEVGGAIYPAKDARMSGELFRHAFPNWQTFSRFIDPRFSSGFWRRVTE